jgi:benzoyl-CoA reductase subunit B
MTLKPEYKTKPLESWKWAKQLRAKHFQGIVTAKEKGQLLGVGMIDFWHSIMAGIDGLLYYTPEAWVSSIDISPELATRCIEAADARGYGRDFCGYIRLYYGSMFADVNPFGGPFPAPDFAVTQSVCSISGKWYQSVGEHLGIPTFAIDRPLNLPWRPLKESIVDYMASQFHQLIEWLEKVTGRRFDDEKLIEGTYNMCRSQVLWSEICQLNQAVPAPLDLKTMYALWFQTIVDSASPESVAFYTALKDEVQDRVDNQIAALATERCRLLHDAQPPWHFLRFFRHIQSYGAVFIGSVHIFNMGGAFTRDQDGTLTPKRDPRSQGITFKSRDEVVRFLAEWDLTNVLYEGWDVQNKIEATVGVARDWHADGMIFHHDRACQGLAFGQMEVKAAVQKRLGIPCMSYESSNVDPRDFAESHVIDSLESYLEGLGLRRL